MRELKNRLFPIALSPAKAAATLGVRPETVASAIKSGELLCYAKGTKRRILVVDIHDWVRTTWKRI